MTHADTDLYRKLRDARRQQGVTQSHLAREIGCKQSAISMMERGRATALARESIKRIAKFLDVDLSGHEPPARHTTVAGSAAARYCPVYDCPSNLPYCVGGDLRFLPLPQNRTSALDTRCRYCGEVLESTCPNQECGAAVVHGAACCPVCGIPYIAVDADETTVPQAWADAQLTRINALRTASEPGAANERAQTD